MPSEKLVLPIVWILKDKAIDGAIIKRLSFQNFADYIGEAQGMKKPKTIEPIYPIDRSCQTSGLL